ncbi:MAG: UvrD-helicase domain-containing protein [Chloroflexi bacterium]|nr:UvrD-helicase domain-containing protein [Chloroflexota bacterium]
MTAYLDGLNERQRTAVTTPPGPVLVLAGPGSGKTRVLTHRIVYLIQELNVPPWHILAVTFTNKAAKEMRHRVEQVMDGRLRGLTMGTFHATCARILRQETDSMPYYDRDFVIFDTADQQQVVKQALRDLNIDDKKFPPNKILNGISNAKNELLTPEIYTATNYIAEVTKRVYARYQSILHSNNAMDFDDLLMNVVTLFEKNNEVLQKYQQRFQHILVDEFQDTNTAQYALLQRIAIAHSNILVVGDSDQSIYKWRGADFRNINRFRETYPNAEVILLEQNYRSTQIILDAAKAVIVHNPNRVHKDLFTERQGGKKITLRESYDEQEEADTIISTIQGLMVNGRSPSDFAVMYRTNAQSRAIEEAFVRNSMPYRLVGATQFYKRREVKDAIAYMRLIHNPADSISFARVINTPTRGIGAKTQQMLRDWALGNSLQPAEALIKLATDPTVQHPFRNRAFKALVGFGELFHAWTVVKEDTPVGELMDLVLDQIGFHNYLDDGTDEGRERWENVRELRGVAVSEQIVTLTEFLEQVALVSETDNLEEGPNAVTLLTLHAAKGLEYPVVFLTGVEDGILPHSRSIEDMESLAEERRLFYVGITRAEDRVFLSHAFRRTFYGETEVAVPSRFLKDIPMELIDGDLTTKRRHETRTRVSSWQWSGSSTKSTGYSSPRKRPSTTSRPSRTSSTPSQSTRRAPAKRPSYTKAPPAAPKRDLPKPQFALNHKEDDFDDERKAKYHSGQRVRHAKFGEGTVIESKVTGNDEEVSVAFPDVGVKRLAASFAKLEIISE